MKDSEADEAFGERQQGFMDVAPSVESNAKSSKRTAICLACYAGLRTPSEPFSLRWSDLDVEHGRLHVRSPKTEHIDGRDVRVVPLMPELRPLLADVFDVAPEGTEYVLQRLMDRYPRPKRGWGAINLRSNCQTELTERFRIHVV